MKSGPASKALDKYWRHGFVLELVVLDCVVLLICAFDVFRFWLGGHAFSAAVGVAVEKLREGQGAAVTAAVLLFFVVGLPMIVALIASLPAIHERWPKLFLPRSGEVVATHLLFSILVASFTAIAIAMEVLAGYENNEGLKYGFRSSWLGIVFLGQPLWASYISPIIRKFFIRLPHEKEPLSKVAKEIITEEPLESQHVA
ncbi:MAG TPA: hypothetical protein VFO46_26085 [Candidatus Sulfotelmatobacter sp.]|nr:hypothetical protein [Candidatus Sulfotelmatobacter sp.]